MELRKKVSGISYFLLQIRNGKATKQRVGEKNISNVPGIVAAFLLLPNPKTFTSHSMRRSSATNMVEMGVPFLNLKNHVGWRSDQVAKGYVNQSERNKLDISTKLLHGCSAKSPTDPQTPVMPATTDHTHTSGLEKLKQYIHIGGRSSIGNLTINFQVI